MSIMEISHRSRPFGEIIERAEASLRGLMSIPAEYTVLFLQGGASSQFAMVPMNLFCKSGCADYSDTGVWSGKAIAEAKKYGSVSVVASAARDGYRHVPEISVESCNQKADFLHITMNNTIYGTRYVEIPKTGDVPLVSDLSSCILSEPYDIRRFGLIYAGAQKNVGPAGLTLVVIRKDLIGKALDITPTMLNYKTHSDKNSLFNTPPCFAIYVAGLVFEWVRERGGVAAMAERNREKARVLYDYIDQSTLFAGHANGRDRSLMNVTFLLPDEQMSKQFAESATAAGLVGLKGHRAVGGLRASIYNAMSIDGVRKLVHFMDQYEKKHTRCLEHV